MNSRHGHLHRDRPARLSRYGPASFVAALGNTLVLEYITWLFLPWLSYFALIIVLPVLVVDLALSGVLAARPGTLGQIGRGMLIGCLSVPLTVVIFALGTLTLHAVGSW